MGELHDVSAVIKYAPMLISFLGMLCAYGVYGGGRNWSECVSKCLPRLYEFLKRKWGLTIYTTVYV